MIHGLASTTPQAILTFSQTSSDSVTLNAARVGGRDTMRVAASRAMANWTGGMRTKTVTHSSLSSAPFCWSARVGNCFRGNWMGTSVGLLYFSTSAFCAASSSVFRFTRSS